MRPFLLAISLLAAPAAHGADLFVGPAQPYLTITDAVAAAGDGDTLWLEPGPYDEWVFVDVDITIRPSTGRVSWTAPSGLEVVSVDDAALTLIDIDFDGGLARRAITAVADSSITVDGSTFASGRATLGGAIYANASSLTVTASDFSDNIAQFEATLNAHGGAIYALSSFTIIDQCSFTANQSLDIGSDGGAVYATGGGSLDVIDSTFLDNVTTDNGGGISAFQTDTDVNRSWFGANVAWDGAGIDCDQTAVCDVHTSVFDTNVAGDDAGGLQFYFGTGTVERSLFCNNSANGNGWGGGLMVYTSSATATNNVFTGNSSTYGGGIGLWSGASIVSQNNTLVGNTTVWYGSAMYSGGVSDITSRNDLFAYNNNSLNNYALYDDGGGTPIEYALFFGNSDFTHNGLAGLGVQTGTDPLLDTWPAVGCSWADYQLLVGSPAIDTGDPAILDPDLTTSDIGALGGPSAPVDLFVDVDLDGWFEFEDCNDNDATINPAADELCDGGGVDEDCDGLLDNQDSNLGDGVPAWPDVDGDGYGDYWTLPIDRCDDGTYALNGDDCNDGDPTTWAGPTWWADTDDDGLGDPGAVLNSCEKPAGYADNSDDCDDGDPLIGVAPDWYPDADGDGEGDSAAYPITACTQPPYPAGLVDNGLDCDDTDPGNFTTNTEICDGLENDCDGLIDTLDPSLDTSTARDWFVDADADGFGAGTATFTCTPPLGMVDNDSDCNDLNGAMFPGNPEICDTLDNDCNGLVDDDAIGAPIWYLDVDSDSFGDPYTATPSCDQLPGTVQADGDCNDADATINPGVTEVCDGIDNNCNFVIDLDAIDIVLWFPDTDGDGFGIEDGDALLDCYPVAGYADIAGDCYPDRPEGYPGAPEICNFLDDNCDLDVDEGLATFPHYPDVDGDGFGDPSATPVETCAPEEGYTADATDCDDANPDAFPGAPEIPGNGADEDCDGMDADADSSRDFEDDTKPGKTEGLDIGCACSSTQAPAAGWLFVPLLALIRRG